jgi:ubiquinone/menaquinone biosynthesis C-methylase UbiE
MSAAIAARSNATGQTPSRRMRLAIASQSVVSDEGALRSPCNPHGFPRIGHGRSIARTEHLRAGSSATIGSADHFGIMNNENYDASEMTDTRLRNRLRDAYEDYYEHEDSEWRRLGAVDKANNIVSLCGNLPQRSVLEIGAGEGSILRRLSELNFGEELCALEISPSGVEAINGKAIPRLAECALFDGYTIPYVDHRFDIAVLSHVIEHVEHPRQLLYEASRVAKYVFVEVPLLDTSRLQSEFAFDRVGHINFYSPRTFRWLVQTCGLRVIRQITTNPSRDTYAWQSGRRGVINHYIKQVLLAAVPNFATKHFSYHGSLVCETSSK